MVLLGRLGKRQQTVEMSNDIRVDLYLRNKLLHTQNQVVEELRLERQNAVFCTQDLLLILLQLLCYIALGLRQRLLAHPFCRHLVLIRVAHLEIIAKHVVIAYLQRRDARLLSLTLLNLQQIVLTTISNLSQFV